MVMNKEGFVKTKKGVASLYVVIFATILFGVITLSFIRIILSESIQSSNDDLSQSAYDSALAGVEDAKIAVNKYYQCINNGGSKADCDYSTLFDDKCDNDGDGFGLAQYLYLGYTNGEVLVQESASGNNSEQAYTCVILQDVVDDYRSTLTSDTRTKVVPLGVGSNRLGNVKYVEFAWYSDVNGTKFDHLDHNGKFNERGSETVPPTISLTLLSVPATFSINDFNNSTDEHYSTMVLLPSNKVGDDTANGSRGDGDFAGGSAVNNISASQIRDAGNSDKDNKPFEMKCTHDSDFACTAWLEVSGLLYAGGNAMLIVSLPYGDIVTDFAVTLYDGARNRIQFEGVQISVDSTGRANQLVRRVETRLDPADVFFPYPQYELELTGTGDDSLRKLFWITANCWTDRGLCARNNGELD